MTDRFTEWKQRYNRGKNIKSEGKLVPRSDASRGEEGRSEGVMANKSPFFFLRLANRLFD